MGTHHGPYKPPSLHRSSKSRADGDPVPIVGGVAYVRTGVVKWWLGGVLMGGAYMVCGKPFYTCLVL